MSKASKTKSFKLADGKYIFTIPQMYEALQKIPNAVFHKHVNDSKNDFYHWVKDVHKDSKLAEDLLECNTKEAMSFCLKSKLKEKEEVFKEEDKNSLNILNELPKGGLEEEESDEENGVPEPVLEKKPKSVITAKERVKKIAKTIRKPSNEKLNKSQIKIIKAENVHQILKKLKGVYEIEQR